MTLTEIRDKYQGLVNAESAMIHRSPFRAQIMKSQEERYIRHLAMSGAMYAFEYAQKGRVEKWLQEQVDTYNGTGNQLNAWSADTVQQMLNDVKAATK